MNTTQKIQKVTVTLIFLLYVICKYFKCYFNRDPGSLDRSPQKFCIVLGNYAHIAHNLDVNFQTYLWPSIWITAQGNPVSLQSSHCDQALEICCI